MSNRASNTFFDSLAILDAISYDPQGLTVGKIQKLFPGLTVGQVGRIVKSLLDLGFIRGENRKHGKTGKVVYLMNEYAAVVCSSIVRNYSEKYNS